MWGAVCGLVNPLGGVGQEEFVSSAESASSSVRLSCWEGGVSTGGGFLLSFTNSWNLICISLFSYMHSQYKHLNPHINYGEVCFPSCFKKYSSCKNDLLVWTEYNGNSNFNFLLKTIWYLSDFYDKMVPASIVHLCTHTLRPYPKWHTS